MQETNKIDQSEEEVRLEKLKTIREKGINPYPASAERTHVVSEVLADFDNLVSSEKEISIIGRLRSIRGHGASIFAHLEDSTAKMQIYVKKDDVDSDSFELFSNLIDVGDFVSATGNLFTTKKGELTVKVKTLTLVSKALLPLPDKWHGLQDEEERYRKRYLDILSNPETKELFVKKFKFWSSMRGYLVSRGFLEVETPVLENITGGADARPFSTHHNALDIEVYLRISAGELWQKKLIVAGYEKVFEIGRIFRNEGMDAEHLQDYTQMEFYMAYRDWNDGMQLVENLVKHVAQEAFDTLQFKIKDFDIDLGKKWETYDYKEEILNRTKIDIEKTTVDEIKKKLQELKVEYEDFDNLPRGIDQLWKYCRKQIGGPGYLIYPPKVISPLAKESEERPGYVEQYQLILAGSELCKGYSELNDPIDQEQRFNEQQALRDAGDDEAQMKDDTFVDALKHGMPPTTGLGISERLFAFLADKPLREAQIFPLMKPKK